MSSRALLIRAFAPVRRASLVAAVLLAAASVPVRGDWLVLSSGEPIETRGPWTVKDRIIVFTSLHGVLSSIRTSSVDVDASRALTAKKQDEAASQASATPEATPPKEPPVLVLTDESLRKAALPTAPAAADADGAGGSGDGGAAGAPRAVEVPASDSIETRRGLQLPGAPSGRVTSWSARPTGDDQLSIFGTVQNAGKLVAAALNVTVKLVDFDGQDLGSTEAAVSATALMPGAQADFEARFQGDPPFATVEFTVKLVELEIGRTDGSDDTAPGEEPDADTNGAPAAAPGVPPNSGPSTAARGDEPHATVAAGAATPRS